MGRPMEQVRSVRSTDGTTIAFARQGTGDPLLLVHGTAGAAESWRLVAPHLEARFTVVTMDRRGRGASGDGVEHSLDLEADDVAAVVDAIGGRVHVVGWSYGARVALSAATRSLGVRSLVLYEPPLAWQHFPAGVVDRVEELVRAVDPAAAAELFLSEVCTPEELEFLKNFPRVGSHSGGHADSTPRAEGSGLQLCGPRRSPPDRRPGTHLGGRRNDIACRARRTQRTRANTPRRPTGNDSWAAAYGGGVRAPSTRRARRIVPAHHQGGFEAPHLGTLVMCVRKDAVQMRVGRTDT